jgi:hypothetical protein
MGKPLKIYNSFWRSKKILLEIHPIMISCIKNQKQKENWGNNEVNEDEEIP